MVRLSSLIELTEKFQFAYVRLPNQSNNDPTDWVRLSSIDFWFGFVRLASPGDLALNFQSALLMAIQYENDKNLVFLKRGIQFGYNFNSFLFENEL